MPAGLFHHPRAEILIRDEQQVLVLRRSFDNFHRVAAGANHVAQRLHRRTAIDVGDGPEIRIGLLHRGEFVRRTAFLERTAGVLVRQHDDFLRVQNLRRLGHEMHAAENNHVGAGFGGLLGKSERIAHKIRDVLDFRHLVIVRQDDGVQLFFERKNLLRQRLEPPFRHRFPRVDICDINHLPKLPSWVGGVNEGKSIQPRINTNEHGLTTNTCWPNLGTWQWNYPSFAPQPSTSFRICVPHSAPAVPFSQRHRCDIFVEPQPKTKSSPVGAAYFAPTELLNFLNRIFYNDASPDGL